MNFIQIAQHSSSSFSFLICSLVALASLLRIFASVRRCCQEFQAFLAGIPINATQMVVKWKHSIFKKENQLNKNRQNCSKVKIAILPRYYSIPRCATDMHTIILGSPHSFKLASC